MANKKIFMSVTATAVIASAFIAAEEADAASHKVQNGDSLWAIAQKYNTSVSQLKSINKLSGDIIYPNQILETEKKQSSNASSNTSSKPKQLVQPTKESATYTVKSGDTLSGIASRHKISLTDLMKWNNLDTTLIFPGNVFVVSSGSGSGSSSGNTNSGSGSGNSGSTNNSGNSSNNAEASIYTVKSGDTLSTIASRNKVTVANLKKWNKLTSDLILIGQKLNIGEATSSGTGNSTSGSNSGSSGNSASEKPTADVSYNIDQLISAAKSVVGTGYVWGGQTASGFDCSGFIHYAYNLAGKTGGRLSTDGYYDRSYGVDKPQIGDLVFFSGTYRAGISHMGIYIGNNEFIHAGTSTGVTITNLNNSYWSKHFDSFKRFY